MNIRPGLWGVLLLGVALWSPPAAVATDRRIKIAVLDFVLHGQGHETADLGQIVAEWLITALVQQGHFDVVERRLLSRILEEQQLAQSGTVDENTAARIGKLLGVKVIVSGSVQRLEQQSEIHFRLIDVESASILAADSIQGGATSDIEAMIAQMALGILRHFPLEGLVLSRESDAVLLDLGSQVGARPGMPLAVFREGATLRHPKTGEVLGVDREAVGTLRLKESGNKTSWAEILTEIAPGAVQAGQLVVSRSDASATEQASDRAADRMSVQATGRPPAPPVTIAAPGAPHGTEPVASDAPGAEAETVPMAQVPLAAVEAAAAPVPAPTVESDSSRALRLLEEGSRLAAERRWEDALAALTQAVDLDPRMVDTWRQRGEVYQRRGDLELALSDYTRALALTPGDAQLHYRCGLLHFRQQDTIRAISAYDRALELDGGLAHVWNSRGLARARQQDYDQAISDYDRALALDDTLTYAWNNRGSAFRHKGDLERAISDFNRALALNPAYAVALGNRGSAYHARQKLAEAQADFDRALALDPKLENVRAERDCIWRELGLEPGFDRPGMDLRSIDLPEADPFACARACREDPACRAFTYQPLGTMPGVAARCRLKSGEPATIPDPAAVSGTVQR